MKTARQHLAFALDYPSLAEAREGAAQVAEHVGVLKVGLELYVQEGVAAVQMARSLGTEVFLDLKLHDIEKTVERAVAVTSGLGAKYVTIHASGGPRMMEAAATRAAKEGSGLVILGVTVLTSLDQDDLRRVGVAQSPAEQVLTLARLAKECGLGGLVCSSEEVGSVREALGPEMILVTPGIRPSGADHGDQKRIGTPGDTIRKGSSLLVVGRPIRDAANPKAAAQALEAEIQSALAGAS